MTSSAPSPVAALPNILVTGTPGCGKCFARGTHLRLYNGDTIAVESVAGGEQLMGDDSQPRTVTRGTVVRGSAALYRINPLWQGASPFTVNGAHILVLSNNTKPRVVKRTDRGAPRWGVWQWEVTTDNRMVEASVGTYDTPAVAQAKVARILATGWEPLEWDVSVEKYQHASAAARHRCKLIACAAVTFNNPQLPSLQHVLTVALQAQQQQQHGRQPAQHIGQPTPAQVDYMAWWLGVWVTDGCSDRASVSQGRADPPDPHNHHEIFTELHRYTQLFNGQPVQQRFHQQSSAGWDTFFFDYGAGSVADLVLRAYGLLNNKHIPRALICDSLAVRRRLLAGIIDGDGYYTEGNTYELQARQHTVIAGYKELAATLGLRNSSIQPHYCTNQQTGQVYTGHRISISGDMWDAVQDCAATYKRCPQPGTAGYVDKNKDTRCYDFDITELDDGDYFGFSVHGGINRRFLLKDYTVTHNVSLQSRTAHISRLMRCMLALTNRVCCCVLRCAMLGCGKSALSARVSELLGMRHVEVGSLVRDRSLHSGWDSAHSAYTLDDDKLCDLLEVELAAGGCIVDFHSTSTFPVRWFALVVVLRCSTHTLYDRLVRRGYSADKVGENVESEIMQVCLDEAREAWDERQVLQLQSDSVEQMDDNVERCAQWLRQWQAEHQTEPS